MPWEVGLRLEIFSALSSLKIFPCYSCEDNTSPVFKMVETEDLKSDFYDVEMIPLKRLLIMKQE